MDRKIQLSMSTMIDLLQPSNENDDNDYSPAEYTQLLNRFLTFDEEMSEIACLYKDAQDKMILSSNICIHKQFNDENNMKITKKKKKKKKKKCKKSKKNNNLSDSIQNIDQR